MFSWFEQLIDPFRHSQYATPPNRIIAFFWHFLRQVWPVLIAVIVVGLADGLIDVQMINYVGHIVDILRQTTPQTLFIDHGREFVVMALVIVLVRPLLGWLHALLVHQSVEANLTNLVRWQTHRHILRQSLGFFHNDFAGRIANKIIQTGPCLRSCIISLIDSVWYVVICATSALFLFARADPLLMIPLVIWLVCYVGLLWVFVPRIKRQSTIMSEARSALSGQIVDSYTNIMTVKLFANTGHEDDRARATFKSHTTKFYAILRSITTVGVLLNVINGFLIAGTGAIAIWLWRGHAITIGAIAIATGLVLRIETLSGWIMFIITGVFEDLGTVENGMEMISKPLTLVDAPQAQALTVEQGAIRFDHIRFHYGKEGGVIEDLTLDIRPGERVGLIGRSGAGKSTLVNLLLRFHDLEGGRILIDGQDIAMVTQNSLRHAIGVVSQDTSLLHRSVRDNIGYGRRDAGDDEIIQATRQAEAHDFILGLEDPKGRRGYDAHVGERGVKLSGGQRQRIAIARVILKDAPILVLDEATSALDSEIEVAIQSQLYRLMAGKTVIAIAHRLSTIARMDRLIVLDGGHIVEAGSHEELLARQGLYSRLWGHQSGGFLDLDDVATA
ncbi:MAG: ABC transporter ATP-binding protein [Hyphomicrobiales bacterium]